MKQNTRYFVLSFILFLSLTGKAFAMAQDQLNEATIQLNSAIKEAELSLAHHQPGSGWTKQHMQALLNILEGKQGKDFKLMNDTSKKEEDGEVLPLLTKTREELKASKASVEVIQAMEGTITFIEQAVEHARMALRGKSAADIHGHARMAAGMLVAAAGRSSTDSPVTGNLEFVVRHFKE